MYSASGGDCPEFQDYGYSHISMVFFMNGMSGAMQEPFAITRRCDEPMRRIIQLRGSSAWRRTRNGRDFRQVRLELLPGKIDFFFPGSASGSDYFTSLENE